MTHPPPTTASGWLALAEANKRQGNLAASLAAIDRALTLEPRNLRALMAKADHFAETGRTRAAVSFYAAVARAPQSALPSDLQQEVTRAKNIVERYAREFEDYIRAALDKKGFAAGHTHPRFDRAVDILVGKKNAYPQQPKYLFFPELAPIQFFERRDFPFLDRLESAYREIRAELMAVLQSEDAFEPYVKQATDRPPSSQLGLAGNRAWTACFLIKDGTPTAAAGRCPKTLEALADAPLPRIRNHSPFVLFSRLTPGARIPPHTGMINTRLICHLALIAPPNCHLRVGNETRPWEEGKAWVFDDTIEHEAWNGSSQDRTVLIFDIWRPDLSLEEREAFAALCEVVEDYEGRREWD